MFTKYTIQRFGLKVLFKWTDSLDEKVVGLFDMRIANSIQYKGTCIVYNFTYSHTFPN